MTPAPRAEIPFREVMQVVRGYVAGAPGGVFRADHKTVKAIAGQAGFDQRQAEHAWEYRGKWDAFVTQVKRALDKLTDEGTLRKAGLGATGPDGREVYRGEIRWYVPAVWAAIERQAADDRQARDTARSRAMSLDTRLHGLGLDPHLADGEVRLDLDGLEYLVTLAEQATGQPSREAAP